MKLSIKNKILNNLYLLKTIGTKYITPIDLKKYDNSIKLPNDMSKLKEIVDNCNLCTLSNGANKIFFTGDINSKIMFISTVSIQNNESVNNIFKSMIENVLKISIKDISILNILKCNNSYKSEISIDDINICKDYLIKQIEISNPKLIVTLGDSYNYLLNDNIELSSRRGMVVKYKNINLIPIYDPSLLLRNPSLKKDTMLDLQKIKSLMELF